MRIEIRNDEEEGKKGYGKRGEVRKEGYREEMVKSERGEIKRY